MYEIRIPIIDEDYEDTLAVALYRQGYAPYKSGSDELCFTMHDEEVHQAGRPDLMPGGNRD